MPHRSGVRRARRRSGGCGCYPRRVAFLPCSHLALCLLCNDVTKKSNAPCVVCGAHVKERLIFYLD
jgi:hypothetical protein